MGTATGTLMVMSQWECTLLVYLHLGLSEISVIPDGVHSESGLRDADARDAVQELVLPPVHLDPALLVVRDGQPLVAPVARGDGIAVAAAGRGGVQAQLLLDAAAVAQAE